MTEQKDSPGLQLALGLLLPLAVLALVAYNLVTVSVIGPARRGLGRGGGRFGLIWYTDGPTVAGFVLLKLAAVVGLVSWFLLANHARTEHFALWGLLLAIAIGVAGLAILVAGMLFW